MKIQFRACQSRLRPNRLRNVLALAGTALLVVAGVGTGATAQDDGSWSPDSYRSGGTQSYSGSQSYSGPRPEPYASGSESSAANRGYSGGNSSSGNNYAPRDSYSGGGGDTNSYSPSRGGYGANNNTYARNSGGYGEDSYAPSRGGGYGGGANDAYSPSHSGDGYAAGGGDAYSPTPSYGGRGGGYSDPGRPVDDGGSGGYGAPYAPPPGEGGGYGNEPPPPRSASRHYEQNEIVAAGHGFFGAISQGLGQAVEYAFKSEGRPNGYILGEDAGGAFVVGLRYGEGTLYTKDAGDHKVYWQGPSLGYDAGAEGSKTMVLVYNLHDPSEIYTRFGGVEGSAYMVGGLSVQFQTYGNVKLAVIRSGVGLRLGANVGYLKYTRAPTWNPL